MKDYVHPGRRGPCFRQFSHQTGDFQAVPIATQTRSRETDCQHTSAVDATYPSVTCPTDVTVPVDAVVVDAVAAVTISVTAIIIVAGIVAVATVTAAS